MSGDDTRMRQVRVRAAWIILVASIAGWPASAWWVWWYMGKFSPFEQLMLFLSCAAITIVALDFLTTAQVHQEQGETDQQA
jgi:uncharacterized membrane protein YfcA